MSHPHRRIFARRLLAGSALMVALCGAASAQEYGQSPSLDQGVSDGSLPPVEERLPAEPFVETMIDGTGTYGGNLRTAILGSGDQYNITRTIANETLVRWTPEWDEVIPSIAREVEVSDDATTFTFHLREGMRWSDGAPFTADDIMFWYEDVFSNNALTPAKNPIFSVAGEPVVVEKVDDFTVVFRFQSAYGLFLQQLAYGQGHAPIIYPKHYLSQFHETYNAEGIPDLLAQNPSVGDWVSLFNSKVSLSFQPVFWQNLELPTLNPWVLTVPYADQDRVVAARNPYYWKVDGEGNQLPYLDTITWGRADDVQLMLLRATSGELDYAFRHINNSTYRSVLFDGQEAGGYRLMDVADLPANDATLILNLNHPDPAKRELFNNKDFRIALSHAIDRQTIIDLVYVGQGEPAQVGPLPEHELYNERLSNQYVAYDPALSNEILDRIGLDQRDAQGFRLRPDGQRVTITFMVADVFGLSYPDIMQMVQQNAAEVGIDIQIRATDRARLNTMWYANEQDAYIWNCVGGRAEAYTDVRCYMPFQKADIFFASAWADWYADHSTGEEPPTEVREHMALYDAVNAAVTDETRLSAMQAFLERSADNFYTIGISRPMPKYALISRAMRNVFEPIPITGNLWHPAPTLTQWYFDEAARQ